MKKSKFSEEQIATAFRHIDGCAHSRDHAGAGLSESGYRVLVLCVAEAIRAYGGGGDPAVTAGGGGKPETQTAGKKEAMKGCRPRPSCGTETGTVPST
jgi:hypothetical protein